MATADQVEALMRSRAGGGDARVHAVATKLATQTMRRGHGKLAQELRELPVVLEKRPGQRQGASV